MRIRFIEPTPSPHTMKLTMDESLNKGVRLTYTPETATQAPLYIRELLGIEGVAGVFQTADFIALEREPRGDWEAILAAAKEKLGVAGKPGGDGVHVGETGARTDGKGGDLLGAPASNEAGFGEVKVIIQSFRGIPMQVRVSAGMEERRAALPERFVASATKAGLASPNLIKERKLEEKGGRYGELQEVLEQVVQELDAAFGEERLAGLVEASFALGDGTKGASAMGAGDDTDGDSLVEKLELLSRQLRAEDWRVRYAALEQLTPDARSLPLLEVALKDAQMSVRRLAVVYVGDLKEEPRALELLMEAMGDPSPIVRRTAGDTLSDWGDPAAMPVMAAALADPSKLVRWRAARYLYEVGDESVLPALRQASEDPEFEVRLQVRMAIERIESGEAASGTVWQQMTRARGGEG